MADAKQDTEPKQDEDKKPKLNRDGLVPGQAVDFDTIRQIEAKRAKKRS